MSAIRSIDPSQCETSSEFARTLRFIIKDLSARNTDTNVGPVDDQLNHDIDNQSMFRVSYCGDNGGWRVDVCADNDSRGDRAELMYLIDQIGDNTALACLSDFVAERDAAKASAKADDSPDDEEDDDLDDSAPDDDEPPSNPGGSELPMVPKNSDVVAWAGRQSRLN